MGKKPDAGTPPKAAVTPPTIGIYDPSMQPALDRLTKLVTTVLKVPIALVSLIVNDIEIFEGQRGLPEPWASKRELPLSQSICQYVIATGKMVTITDSRKVPELADTLAVRELKVVAYAGLPVVDGSEKIIGSLCAIDHNPRKWSDQETDLLKSLALQVSAEIQIRQHSTSMASSLSQQRSIEADRQQLTRLNVHDLRTPLAAMMTSNEMIPRLGPLTEAQEDFLAISKRNGDALTNLLNNLIDIGNIDHRGQAALNYSDCQPGAAVQAAAQQVQILSLEKKIALKTDLGNAVPNFRADCDKLTRVLVNLLANAIKFTRECGKVEVKIAPTANALVEFSIHDTGIGIANAEFLFQEGVRVDQQAVTRRSTGLGLTFCKRIVEAHGGKIWFNTKLGEGTSFFFTIPTATA